MLSLNQLEVGDKATIKSIDGIPRQARHQLAILGLKKRQVVLIKEVAPLGDPICVEVGGTVLVLRRAECEGIAVEKL